MNMGAGVQLPQYRCHKVVRAAKITAIEVPPDQAEELPLVAHLTLGEIGGVWTAPQDWMDKNKPQAGGYLVEYEDGYRSYSPAKAFEEGYTKIPDGTGPGIYAGGVTFVEGMGIGPLGESIEGGT